MSNGNDWESDGNHRQQSSGPTDGDAGGRFGPPSGEGGGRPGGSAGGGFDAPGSAGPAGGPGGGGGEPPGDGPPTDLVTEGWGDGPEVTVDEVIERLKLVASRAKGPILIAWLGLGAALLLFELTGTALHIVGYFIDNVAASGVLGTLAMIIETIATVAYYIVGALQFALFKPLHRAIFEGEQTLGGPLDVLKEGTSVFLYMLIVTVLLSIGTGLGTFCCIVPGLFIGFVFCQAPYLTATQGLSPIEAFKRSLALNKTYWMVILAAVAALVVLGMGAGCLISASGFAIGLASSVLRPFGAIFIDGFLWISVQLALFGAFLIHAALFSTIESKETGKMPV